MSVIVVFLRPLGLRLADDGDPLDGMVIIDQPTFPGCVIAARPIGFLEMIDGGDRDEKILCVPDKDPRYAHVKSLKDIAPKTDRSHVVL